jgi:hypothetical protein
MFLKACSLCLVYAEMCVLTHTHFRGSKKVILILRNRVKELHVSVRMSSLSFKCRYQYFFSSFHG